MWEIPGDEVDLIAEDLTGIDVIELGGHRALGGLAHPPRVPPAGHGLPTARRKRTGFDVVDYRELRAPDPTHEVRHFASANWSHRFPSEQIWKVRKR